VSAIVINRKFFRPQVDQVVSIHRHGLRRRTALPAQGTSVGRLTSRVLPRSSPTTLNANESTQVPSFTIHTLQEGSTTQAVARQLQSRNRRLVSRHASPEQYFTHSLSTDTLGRPLWGKECPPENDTYM
jgi:hypothetical protein